MVEWAIADCCACSKSAAKLRLEVEIWVSPTVGRVAPPAFCSNGPAVFAVFAGNDQRQTIPAPQKYSISGGVVKERTAGQRQIRAGSSARWQK
jgi:hypothetical protein